jgi:PmbA protein
MSLVQAATRACEGFKDGALEVYLVESYERFARVFQGEPERATSSHDLAWAVRVLSQGRVGIAYGEGESEDGLRQAIETATAFAALSDPDPDVALPGPVAGIGPEEAIAAASEVGPPPTIDLYALADLENRLKASSTRIEVVEQVTTSVRRSIVVVVNSLGALAVSVKGRASAYVQAIFSDESCSYAVWGSVAAGEFSGLDLDELLSCVLKKGEVMRGARKPRTERLVVVFDHDGGAQFLRAFATALSAQALHEGRSFYAGHEGEEVAPAELTLLEDPTHELAWRKSTFDDEGSPCRPVELISKGRLVAFLSNPTYARKTGWESTSSSVRDSLALPPSVGARALRAEMGKRTTKEILAEIDRGLLVTSLSGWHSGVNPVSGDFSVGIEGVIIDKGELGPAVREAVIASTLPRMLQNLVAVSTDQRMVPGSAVGATVAVADMTLSGR